MLLLTYIQCLYDKHARGKKLSTSTSHRETEGQHHRLTKTKMENVNS